MKAWIIIGGAVVLGVVLMMMSGGGDGRLGHVPSAVQNATGGNDGSSAEPADFTVLIDDDDVLGDPAAPVTIIEFGDYQCSFCTRFFNDTLPLLKERYIDTGVVKFVFRDFAINGRESINAALASECAGDQGGFWEYHDKLFQERKGYSVGVFTEDNLVRFADEVGLNGEELRSCYTSGVHSSEIAKDRADASRFGARGTPTFLVNGRLVPGAQPFSAFEQLIQESLQ